MQRNDKKLINEYFTVDTIPINQQIQQELNQLINDEQKFEINDQNYQSIVEDFEVEAEQISLFDKGHLTTFRDSDRGNRFFQQCIYLHHFFKCKEEKKESIFKKQFHIKAIVDDLLNRFFFLLDFKQEDHVDMDRIEVNDPN